MKVICVIEIYMKSTLKSELIKTVVKYKHESMIHTSSLTHTTPSITIYTNVDKYNSLITDKKLYITLK